MPTIGELLAQIRNGGMNPEPTGDSPYTGVQGGTNSPISQPGIDDINEDTRAAASDYTSQRTKGFEKLEEQNAYPIEPDLKSIRMTDPNNGNPSPLTSISNPQTSFIDPTPGTMEETDIKVGFEILKKLGFFLDLDGDDGPEYDKNGQLAGHSLLNRSDVKEKINAVLASTRFSTLTKPDAPFATSIDLPEYDFINEEGVRKDHPQIEKIKEIAAFVMNTGKRAKDAFPDAKMILANSPDATGTSSLGKSANLQYGDINPDTGIDSTSGQPDASQGSENTPPDGNNTQLSGISSNGISNTPDFPYGADHNELGAAAISLALDVVFEALGPTLDLLDGLFGLFNYNGVFTNLPHNPAGLAPGARYGFGNYPSPSQIDFSTGETAQPSLFPSANSGYRFIRALAIPVPKFALTAIGDPNDLIKNLIKLGIQSIKEQLKADPTTVSYWKAFSKNLKKILRPENNFGLPKIPNTPVYQLTSNKKFIQELKDCSAMQFIRSMAILAENIAASGVSGGSALQPQPYRFSGIGDLNRMVNSAVNRHAATRVNSMRHGLSSRNIPSLMLLPAAFSTGRSRWTGGQTSLSVVLSNNKDTNSEYQALLNGVAAPELALANSSAVLSKLGNPTDSAPGGGASANRFSREEVEAIENMLEAEHVPFYFHDLRTNEIVSFHAFLNALSDSFSPTFNASSGFGRIEDVQIYQKTTRAIQVDFTLVSMNKADMREMYWKMNKLIAMVYPQFSRGTMLEHTGEKGTTRFVQPFSQVTTATPLIRLRVGDLIKSNYSREAVARLMGVSDPNFQLLEPGPGAAIEGFTCQEAVDTIVELTERVPLDPSGQWDGTGWPIGSTVILDPPYDPLVAFDPETQQASSDWSATVVQGNIGVKILEYIPFSNPLGGTSPNQEEIIVKVELVSSAPAPFFPTQDRIGTRNATGEIVATAMLSYRDINTALSAELFCYGINTEYFPDLEITEPGFQAFEEDAINQAETEMRERLFGDKNPIMRSFETTAGRGLAGVITSLNFDWGINGEINWDTANFGYKAPKGCKISISFTPIHDITPGLDADGMIRAPVFNVAGASPHKDADVHPGGYARRSDSYNAAQAQYLKDGGE